MAIGKKWWILFSLLLSSFFFWAPAQAAVYFSWDAENSACDTELPNPPFWTQETSHRGKSTCGPTLQGSRFFEWVAQDYWHDAYTEISSQALPVSLVPGRTYYLAYYFNYTRINGRDIWRNSDDSADKGVEITGSGIRWVGSVGHWSSLATIPAGKFTIWGGNPTYHVNRSLEVNDIYLPNQNGYSAANPIQLDYDRWHSAVMAVKVATDSTGLFALYVNGAKLLEYANIRTAANSSPTVQYIEMNGTIAQPAYDAPAHRRMFDGLILTDNWQDVVNGGYLRDMTPPQPPSGLRIR